MGKLLYSTVGGGVAEGTGVGTTGTLVELQAVQINNPSKLLNRGIHLFLISHLWLSTGFLEPTEALRTHELAKIL